MVPGSEACADDAGGDSKLNVRLGILASWIKRNKVILCDAAFLKLGNDSERRIFIIVYQIDTFVRRNLNDFIQEHMVENCKMEESRVSGKVSMARAVGKRTHWYPRKREGSVACSLKRVLKVRYSPSTE